MAKTYDDVTEIIDILFSADVEKRLQNDRDAGNDSGLDYDEDIPAVGEESIDSDWECTLVFSSNSDDVENFTKFDVFPGFSQNFDEKPFFFQKWSEYSNSPSETECAWVFSSDSDDVEIFTKFGVFSNNSPSAFFHKIKFC